MLNNPNDPSNATNPGLTPDAGSPPGLTPNPPSLTTESGPPSDKTPLSALPVDVQDYIKRLRDEAEEANKQKKAEAKAKQLADEAHMREQGQYKELAAQHEARVKELEPISERFTQLSTLVADQITTETRDWPAELKTFDPGPDAPVEQRLEWVKKSRPLIEKLQQQARSQQPGNSPNPKPAGGSPEDLSKQYERKLRAQGGYFKI